MTARFPCFLLSAAMAVLAACGNDADAGMVVGDVAFPSEEVAELPYELRHSLADVAAFGQAIAGGETAVLGAPIVERRTSRSRLRLLPLELAAAEMGISEAELRAAYAAAPEWELRVRHMVRLAPRWATDSARTEAQRIAEDVRRRALAGEDFAALAAEFSEEPGAASSGGLLDPGREGSWVAPFWAAAAALEPGEISPVTKTQFGYHVLQVEERRPVPFEDASRARLLTRLVPDERAAEAMTRWAEARSGAVMLDPPAIAAARQRLSAGEAPDSLILARWPEGDYSAWDLAVHRAALDGESRPQLDGADDAAFGSRVQADATEAMWAAAAAAMGIDTLASARSEAEQEWNQRTAGWASWLGFREGMSADQVRAASLEALRSTGQDSRIGRLELEGIRPLLRARYSVSGPAAPASALSSSSEARNSESTR